MEFKLNKIDTDIMNKLQDEIKQDKIHESKKTSIKKDLKEHENRNNNNQDTNRKPQKKLLTINGVKYIHKPLFIQVEKLENLNEENSRGKVLDTKK